MTGRRIVAILAVVVLTSMVASTALAASITVRVEGRSQTIFGSVPRKAEAANAQEALELASVLGEFYYGLTVTSFGPYVSQIGKYPAGGAAGWVFKVNGISPPVGADQVTLNDGDQVLWYWATFSATGGQATLALGADSSKPNCYVVTAFDDAGKTSVPAATLVVDGRRVKTTGGKGCVGKHRGLVKAFAVGAVRSNAVK